MDKQTTILSLRNTTARIDPFRYPADVGALADALLVAHRIIIAVETLSEVLCVADWLGPDFQTLINDGTLRFFFSDGNLEPTIIEGQLYILAHARDGFVSHITTPGNRQLPARDIERELRNLCATYPYLSDNFNPGPGWEAAVAATGALATSKYNLMVRQAVTRLLADESAVARLSHSYSTARGIANHFPAGFRISEDGRVHRPDKIDVTSEGRVYIHALLQQSQRFFASAILDAELQIVEGDWAADLFAQATTTAGEPRETAALSSILNLEGLPSVRASVFMQEIPGSEIVKLRNSDGGQRFRQWLNEQSATRDADALIRTYHQTVGSVVNKDQTWFGALRVLGSTAVGVLSPLAGLLASAADFVFGKVYYRARWHPRIFVRTMPSIGGPNASINVPVDPIPMLRRGAKVRAGRIGADFVRLELEICENDPDRPGEFFKEAFNLDYGPPNTHVLRIFNTRMASLLASSDVPISVECTICKTETLLVRDSIVHSVSCRQCGGSVFPLSSP